MTRSILTPRDRVWHAAYRRWYDHDQANHGLRAKSWGWVADRLCRLFWGA
jgi:hypothetical protein